MVILAESYLKNLEHKAIIETIEFRIISKTFRGMYMMVKRVFNSNM